ncbi:MAG: type II secretion system F family protein [Planctomycetota bacterium]|jgi:type IV pilus assembly protein PilC
MASKKASAMAKKKAAAVSAATPQKKIGFSIGGVSEKQLTQFTVQLSTLQDAGLPIVSCLKILEGQLAKGYFKNVLLGVTDDVESGASLSEALAKHPRVFDTLYVNMVRAGEAGGVLDVILARLAAFKEKAEKLKRRVKGAATYPVAVLIVIVLILLFIMTNVVPKFEEVFSGLPGGEEGLPGITKVMMGISQWLVQWWWAFILTVILLFWAIPKLVSLSAAGRYFLDEMKLRMPPVGELYRKVLVARFTRTFGTLVSSGVPILEALDIVRGAAGNAVMAKVIGEVRDAIREGESIADPLSNQKVRIFDDLVVNMIDVGEKTGELDKMLIKIADNYDEEVDVAVGGLTSLLEPMLIVVMGGAVFVIVLALFLPLLKIIDTLTGGG